MKTFPVGSKPDVFPGDIIILPGHFAEKLGADAANPGVYKLSNAPLFVASVSLFQSDGTVDLIIFSRHGLLRASIYPGGSLLEYLSGVYRRSSDLDPE